MKKKNKRIRPHEQILINHHIKSNVNSETLDLFEARYCRTVPLKEVLNNATLLIAFRCERRVGKNKKNPATIKSG